jgi:hypothetical protein
MRCNDNMISKKSIAWSTNIEEDKTIENITNVVSDLNKDFNTDDILLLVVLWLVSYDECVDRCVTVCMNLSWFDPRKYVHFPIEGYLQRASVKRCNGTNGQEERPNGLWQYHDMRYRTKYLNVINDFSIHWIIEIIKMRIDNTYVMVMP